MKALKISGYRNLESLVAWASSYMVDIAYVSHEGDGFALLSPEGDAGVESAEDFEWLRGIVQGSLKEDYGPNVIVDLEPVDPAKESGVVAVAC
jgi:hypothetical protein